MMLTQRKLLGTAPSDSKTRGRCAEMAGDLADLRLHGMLSRHRAPQSVRERPEITRST